MGNTNKQKQGKKYLSGGLRKGGGDGCTGGSQAGRRQRWRRVEQRGLKMMRIVIMMIIIIILKMIRMMIMMIITIILMAKMAIIQSLKVMITWMGWPGWLSRPWPCSWDWWRQY